MNIFKYFLEADDDDNTTASRETNDAGGDVDASDSNTNDDAGDDSNDDTSADDFDMDADLGDSDSGDSSDGDSSDSGSFGGGGGDGEEETDEEVKKQNADMFSSLSPEEQKIKILELKRLYHELYTNCDDILKRVNDMPVDEDTITVISRISTAMYRIKVEMEDYLKLRFPLATYYENDVAYNRFLYFYNSVAEIVEEVAKKREKEIQDANH